MATFYNLCERMQWLPHEARKMSVDDYYAMIATLTKDTAPVEWGSEAKSMLKAWAAGIRKANGG